MQFKTVKQIKEELRRLRKRQNIHQNDDRVTRKKIRLRKKLWKLLREQSPSRKNPI